MKRGKTNLKKVLKAFQKHKKNGHSSKTLIIVDDDDGPDVIFNFKSDNMSVWKGVKTSVMAADHEGRRILKWVVNKIDNDDANEIIEKQLDRVVW